MATNWIALFEASAPPDISDKSDNSPREKPIVSNVPIVRPEKYEKLIEELNQLNARWEKANTLERAGTFEGISQARQERICEELRAIIGRATKIWERLQEENPAILNNLYLLEG